jgi:hypothetical protein
VDNVEFLNEKPNGTYRLGLRRLRRKSLIPHARKGYFLLLLTSIVNVIKEVLLLGVSEVK